MKPHQNLSSDPTAIHKCKRMAGRLRQAFQATVAVHEDHISESLAIKTDVSTTKEVARLKRKVSVEDPIRTIMFLGSWSHT
ncbi:hypothetical protein CTI12_AA280850 [Artemisia annua]|uniref:Uncharacterized protein n=1 Tax=Artemisia annua TaxID=35608 RepID=A0A2U1ND60_ARTAN|nr:hypothetical protein CTI12_AA280850 [Artemisia annua]